jgi:TorA maturation chaperone TorD
MAMTSEFLEHEVHRARVYRLLADAFRPPVPALSEGLAALGSLLTKLESTASDTAAGLVEAFEQPGDLKPLKIDFAHLFVGPFLVLAPPYGSVYLEEKRRIMGDTTMDVLDHYRALGLDIADNFKDAPDHVCAELEFMHVLVCRQAEALRTEDGDRLVDSRQRQHAFLGNHAGAWIPDFAAKVMEHAETQFYRFMGEVTKHFVEEESEALEIQIPERPIHAVF